MCQLRGIAPPPPQYLQVCKKVGQKAAMLEEIWQQYFLGAFFSNNSWSIDQNAPPPPTGVLAHHWIKPSFCLNLNFLNLSRNWAWNCLTFCWNKLAKIGYTSLFNNVYLDVEFHPNILNAIMTKYRFLASKNTYFWKLSLVIFLRFWPFEPHFLIDFFLTSRTCTWSALTFTELKGQ